jgi:hypothetical protein
MSYLVCHSPRRFGLVAWACLMIGCSGAPDKKYIPAAVTAKGALAAALEKWKSGAAHATVIEFDVPIDIFDARWQNGKKLASYEILHEVDSTGPKTFAVLMKLEDENEPKEVTYLVVGKNPLLIFREQDYQKAAGTGG